MLTYMLFILFSSPVLLSTVDQPISICIQSEGVQSQPPVLSVVSAVDGLRDELLKAQQVHHYHYQVFFIITFTKLKLYYHYQIFNIVEALILCKYNSGFFLD